MSTTEPEAKSTKTPPAQAMASTAVVARPVASIFTKEGLQKCMEQQSAAQKSKRSRKKEPTASAAAALTPPDSAQETQNDTQSVKARRSRSKTSATEIAKNPTPRRGKRKKKDEDGDDVQIIDRPEAIKAFSSRVTRSASRSERNSPVRRNTASGELEAEIDVGSVILEEDTSEAAVDLNHSRRKRRKKSPTHESEAVVLEAVNVQSEDIEMADSPRAEVVSNDKQADPNVALDAAKPNAANESPAPIVKEQDLPQAANPAPPPKPVHPFFTLGGIKKSEAKPVHPFFAPGGMKKQQATQLVIQNPPKRDSPSNTIPAVNIVPKFSSTSKEKMPISVPPSSEGISKPLLSPASRAVLRLSGLMETPWPDAQQRHVRQRSPDMAFQSQIGTKYRTERKLKTRKVEITAAEDLLENLSKSLHIETCMKKLMEPNFREEEYFRVSSTLKLPRRAIMTGSRLQDEIRKRTVTRLPYPGPATIPESREDSVASDVSEETEKKRLHSALEWLYRLLYTIVTPFDIGAHESLLWTHKYAPQCSADVLQVGREMEVLRDWMQKLAVDSGSEVPGNPKKKKRKQKNRDGAGNVATNAKGGRRKKKRKRTKGDGLDDFLVDTDEEQDEMDEITDPEDNGSTGVPGIFSAQSKKSAIRTGDKRASLAAQLGYVPDGGLTAIGGGENGKMVNAVVISGPHGCGKTAAVYAVAKEMGYQVFEVNPGTRRSGKDILDQVGEMSKNHLVHQQKVNPLDPNFFQNTKNRRKNKKQVEELIEKAQQTQSLILLEEVDLLYEEDKQFWATVMTLMGQSKRPIVMTCNDESLLPIDDLSLHAILRLSAPPEDLAVDYLLLMAANEGHLLQRSEVSALYNTMKGDLRAMIMELNFWCQMGIGDRRAGLDWILQRFPVGCDIDDNGERKRVISENTYIGGMGWVPKKEEDDGVTPQESTGRMLGEDDIWKSVWEEWCIDVGTDGEGPMRGMEGWTEQIGELKAYEHKRLASHAFSVYAEALSDADVYAGPGMRTLENPILDPTQPKRSPSSTIDDLLGYTMLQTDPWPSNPTSRGTFTSLATCIRSLARCFLASETNALLPPSAELTMLTPQRIVQAISARFRTERETASIPAQYIQSAFTHLAAPPATTTALSSTSSSGASISGTAITTTSIHGPLPKLVLDIAPYTRAIVRYDQKREEARIKTSNLLSAGGNGGREARRSTRAARLAMEGGDRGAGRGRKERYFLRGNARWMVSTGGEGWGEKVEEMMEKMKGEEEGGGKKGGGKKGGGKKGMSESYRKLTLL